jgi:hypothetical protein
MKTFVIIATACFLTLSPAWAQEKELQELADELEKFSDSARQLLEGWADTLGPALEGLSEKIGDLSNYEAPEILPNGDIIIRRKKPKPKELPDDDGSIEL